MYSVNLANFKPIRKNDKAEDKNTASADNQSQNAIYKPAKLNPVLYDDGKDKKVSNLKRKRRAAKMLLAKEELSDDDKPVEIAFGLGSDDAIYKAKLTERETYEEENFTRLQLTKQDRKKRARVSNIDHIAAVDEDLEYINALLNSGDEDDEQHRKPKRRSKKGGKRKHFKRK
ncbi:hypothetical protein Ciccas_002143 [Cichlidogyrus casuarinus]|uniref:Uncharacterized protein n=1 Tax=Cichlidogyrus casuarinus TaxID=1844966 RepID=A0ABD2QL88_9PLAT